MGYKSIVLNLDIDGMVAPVIKLGVDLAAIQCAPDRCLGGRRSAACRDGRRSGL